MAPKLEVVNGNSKDQGGIVLLKKILSSIGIGSARLDLVLPRERYCAGEEITGYLQVFGGIADQLINRVYVQLVAQSKYKKGEEVKNIVKVLDEGVLTERFRIGAHEEKQEVPVKYVLPEDIPVTTNATRLYLVTGLDISSAVDPKDSDLIEVLPGRRQAVIMQALERELGFVRKRGTGMYNGHYQEFEYRPGSFMRGKLDELEVVYHVRQDGVSLFVQIDKKARGLGGLLADALDLDERNVSFFLSNAQITTPREVASLLAQVIEREYRRCI